MNSFGRKLVEVLDGIAGQLGVFTLPEFSANDRSWHDSCELAINGALDGKEFGLAFIQEGLRKMAHSPGCVVSVQAFATALAATTMKRLVGTVRYQGAHFIEPGSEAIQAGDIAVTRLGHPAVVLSEEYIAGRGVRSFRVIEAITGPNGERHGSTIRHHVRRTADVRYFIRLCGEAR